MDPSLLALIRAYQARVEWAVEQLVAAGIERPASATGWASSGVEQRGDLPGGVRYRKHGFGCAVMWPGGSIDFDFGEAGQITGFDASRLWHYQAGGGPAYFENTAQLDAAFKAARLLGVLEYSGYILYYLSKDDALARR